MHLTCEERPTGDAKVGGNAMEETDGKAPFVPG